DNQGGLPGAPRSDSPRPVASPWSDWSDRSAPHPPYPTPVTGVVLDTRYRLLALVGTGRMAAVWQARDLLLDRDVAVKVFTSRPAAKQENPDGVRAEVQVLVGMQHPNITAVHGYGEIGG